MKIYTIFLFLLFTLPGQTLGQNKAKSENRDLADSVYIHSNELTRTEMNIVFRVGRSIIDSTYMDNSATLHRMVEWVNSVQQDSLVDIVSVEFCGAVSPEGSSAINKKLSQARLTALEKYLRSQIDIPEEKIVRNDHYISWPHLSKMVSESDISDKERILAIIDKPGTTQANGLDSRITELKSLNGGRAWNTLYNRFFVHMRNAYTVLVTCKSKLAIKLEQVPEPEPEPIPIPEPIVEPEPEPIQPICPLSEEEGSYSDTECYPHKTIFALKSNLLYDALSLVNFSIEVPFSKRFSLLYYHQFPWWRWGEAKNEYCLRFLSIGGEARWWFIPKPKPQSEKRISRDKLVGHFFGIYSESGLWDFERRRDICHQGEFWSVGLSYGYAMPIGRRLNLEFSLSAGYASIPYRGYFPNDDYEILWRDPSEVGTWQYFGLTKAQISLVIPITSHKLKTKKGGER